MRELYIVFSTHIGRIFFSLCSNDITGVIFCDRCAIWSVHVSVSLRMIPRKLNDFTLFIGRLFIFMLSASYISMFRRGV